MKTYDCVVVGAGPGGLTAALYLCRFGLSVALVEKLTPGGQMLSTFEIANYPGFPEGAAGWKLVDDFVAHLAAYSLDRIDREVTAIRRDGDLHVVEMGPEAVAGKTVIACSGATPRKLGIEGERRLTGRGVSYCAMCDGMFFKNKVVAIAGGGNAALEEAVHLAKIVKKIYIIHRRNEFRADQVIRDKVEALGGAIETIRPATIAALQGDEKLTGVVIEPVNGGAPRVLEVDGLFVFIGILPVAEFLPEGLKRDAKGFVEADCEMRTSIPGFFVAGDLRAKRCRQVVTAVGDGATAAYSAFAHIEGTLD